MKKIIYFVALMAIANATSLVEPTTSHTLSNTSEKAILDFRDQMPCGFPTLGLPSLAPFIVSHKDVNIDNPGFSLNGSLENFCLLGLNNFTIGELKVNDTAKKTTFRLLFKKVHIDSSYNFKIFVNKTGFNVNTISMGHAKFSIIDLEYWGALRYSLDAASTVLQLEKLEAHIYVGDVESEISGLLGNGAIDREMNEVLEESAKFVVNENDSLIKDAFATELLPMINNYLRRYPLKELVKSVGNSADNNECKSPMNQYYAIY